MIAMQYSFTLPADYDMTIVERRVQEKGSALDDHKPLAFKAYLIACKGDTVTQSHENLYAPFYLWHDNEGMGDFLCGKGFLGLVNSFGWPAVRTWPLVVAAELGSDIAQAAFATREIHPMVSFTPLDTLRADESQLVGAAVQGSAALTAVTAFEPTTWNLVRFRLWRDMPSSLPVGVQAYNVLHVSHPSGR
jgi:hypothetical protein